MELPNKDLGTLFEQLGLPSDPASIDAFIASHWSEAQGSFLKELLMDDAEWAPVVDELNVRLHEQGEELP
mgnify:CR=1 FL=1